MKNLKNIFFIVFLLSSCTPVITVIPTVNPTITSTKTPTQTFTPTSTITTTSTSTPMLLPDNITIQVGEGKVTQSDISEITEALAIIHSYLIFTFGTDLVLENPLTVVVIGVGVDNQAPGDLKGQCCGHMYAGKPGLFFDVRHPIWLQGDMHIPENPYMHHLHNVAHEYTHLWQESQGCFSTPGHPDPTPMRWWLSEGMAEYMSAASLVNAGKLTWQQTTEEWQLADAEGAPYIDFPSLKTMEFDFQGWDYSFGYLAVERLVQQSPKGILSLQGMCQNAAKGMVYSKAFQDAFSQSVDTFYSDFPIYVQEELSFHSSNIPLDARSLDTSVCLPQSDSRVKCLGLFNNNGSADFVFEIPFDGNNLPPADQWRSVSGCYVSGWGGTPTSSGTFELLISFDSSTHGACHIKVAFSAIQEITVDLVVP